VAVEGDKLHAVGTERALRVPFSCCCLPSSSAALKAEEADRGQRPDPFILLHKAWLSLDSPLNELHTVRERRLGGFVEQQ